MNNNYRLNSGIEAISHYLCSMLFLSLSLLFPFLISIQYHEPIPIKTINIAVGMYLLTIATSARNIFFFFSLLIFATFMFSSYGSYKQTDMFELWKEIWTFKGIVVMTATLLAAIEKWNYHVIKGNPFVPFFNRNE